MKGKTTETESFRNDPSWDEIHISAPWGASNVRYQSLGRASRGEDAVDPNHFLTERSRVHEVYIREQEKTRRLSLFLSTTLLLGACSIVVFAPEGREYVSNWVGAALLVTAAGAAGYTRIWGRSRRMSLIADQGEVKNDAER